jgi:hypothetical protein
MGSVFEYHRLFGGKRMKARGWIATSVVGAASVLAAGILVHSTAKSADHLDSPATTADGTLDINDLYTWNDGTNSVFVLTVTPAAPKAALFSDAVQYVIHTSSGAAYPVAGADYQIICTFSGTTAPQTAQCWAGTDEYATGQADNSAGISSKDGKFKVFAGVRGDPFFFNLAGFRQAVTDVEGVGTPVAGYTDAGCPKITNLQAAAVAGQLSKNDDGGPPQDFFKTFNALAIVVSIDKTLVTKDGPIVATWASTHK